LAKKGTGQGAGKKENLWVLVKQKTELIPTSKKELAVDESEKVAFVRHLRLQWGKNIF